MAEVKITQAQDDEFQMVSDGTSEPETKIVMDVTGDQFTGEYLGMRTVPSDTGSYQQARFRGDDEAIYFINANHSLKDGLKTVRIGSRTRITYADNLDTGMPQPMRVYSVEVARRNPGRRST